ncbi:MAG: tetratricopeptide repeat protein [Anaerolineales bacterium]|nr:tetratricopeptide repeat protein [Anaerolineales bacterium]MCB8954271.1 tetratricopeptide repeat protein [Ardenticatenales bacterium]
MTNKKHSRKNVRRKHVAGRLHTGESFEVHFRRGTELLMQGNHDEAVASLEQAYELDQAHSQAALNLSGAYILTKQFKRAVAVLERLSQREPDNPVVWQNLGAAYLGNPILATDNMQQQAIDAFRRALDLNPAAPNVAYNLGLVHRDRREYGEATFWFRRAVQTNPNDDDARQLLARVRVLWVEEEE